ncbi:MAG: hypothetical protein UHL70_02470 [Acutalibacteraceae bacterium]|nr:hypothetical protein [Acutalibacteraceae bacterium]
MAKCIKCNGSFLTRGKIKLKDAYICFKCADALGFDHKTLVLTGSLYSWDDIKDGYDAYRARKYAAEKPTVKIANYGQLRDINATDEESEIFDQLRTISGANDLKFVRRSDSYVTAAIGPTDVARFKYTARAKWIRFPYVSNDKIPLASVESVSDLHDEIIKSVETARRLNK